MVNEPEREVGWQVKYTFLVSFNTHNLKVHISLKYKVPLHLTCSFQQPYWEVSKGVILLFK